MSIEYIYLVVIEPQKVVTKLFRIAFYKISFYNEN